MGVRSRHMRWREQIAQDVANKEAAEKAAQAARERNALNNLNKKFEL